MTRTACRRVYVVPDRVDGDEGQDEAVDRVRVSSRVSGYRGEGQGPLAIKCMELGEGRAL